MNNHLEYVDFNEICRLCLRKTDLSPFFDLVTKHISNQTITFLWMLENHVKFKICKGDDKPQNVCNRCLSQIYHSYHFFEMCVISNNILDEVLRHRNSKNFETVDHAGPEHNLNPINYPFSIPTKIVVKIIQDDQDQLLADDTENDPLIEEDNFKIDIKEVVCEYDQNIEQFDYDNADVSEDYKIDLNSINSLIGNGENKIIKTEDDQIAPTLPKGNFAGEKSVTAEEHNYSINHSSTKKKKKVAKKIKVTSTSTSPEKRRIIIGKRKSHFTCQICKEIFVTFKDVIDHFDNVHGGSTRCILCDKLFRNKNTKLLKYHMNTHIHNSARFDCVRCFQYFLTRTEMEEHYQSKEHSADPKVCKICNKRNRTSVLLKRHMLSHTKKKQFQCTKCGKCFKYVSNLSRHFRVSHKGVRLLCNICGKVLTTKIGLNNHIRGVHGGEKSHLDWGRRKLKKRKIKTQGDDGSVPKICRFCEAVFETAFGRELHESLKHSSEREFHCSRCLGIFPSVEVRNAHMDNVHYKHKCPHCNRGYSTEVVFKRHLELHDKPGYTKCIQCNLECKTQHALRVHMNTHTGDRPYKCDKCDKAFRQPAHLKHHQFMHTRKKHFKCHLCKKTFGLQHSLKSHLNTHEGKRPWPCNLCDKAYINKGTLTKHLKKLHGVEKHKKTASDLSS